MNESKCLVKFCDDIAKSRGLCANCYTAAWTKVKEGSVTWEELLKEEMVKPPETKYNAFSTNVICDYCTAIISRDEALVTGRKVCGCTTVQIYQCENCRSILLSTTGKIIKEARPKLLEMK